MPTPGDYSRVTFSKQDSTYSQRTDEGITGEFGPVVSSDTLPEYSDDLVPTRGDPSPLQFTSDKASTPKAMASETSESQNAELQTFLMNNLETPGTRVCHPQSKPWTPPHGAEGEK
jgi:hypothetical protein